MAEGEQEDEASKTEDPTQKKLDESRKRGQVALSREVNNWLMLFSGTIIVLFVGPDMMQKIKDLVVIYLEQPDLLPQVPGGFETVLGEALLSVIKILFLPLGILFVIAFAGPFLQVGAIFAPEVIKPDISKISPMKGFQRLFSMRSIVEFLKGLMKIAVIGAVGYIIISPFFGVIDTLAGISVIEILTHSKYLFAKMMTGVLIVLLIIAAADLLYQRLEHYKKMRMTKHEVKEEYKQAEGDPQIKAKLRQLRRERARFKMMQAVPKADVVITNPTHFAIALKYELGKAKAPICVAKGQDFIALKIREVATEHGVEIYENPPLARALFDVVEIEQEIPVEMYQAVAEVISYVFKKQGKM